MEQVMTDNFPKGYYLWDLWYMFEEETNTFHSFRLSAAVRYKEEKKHDTYARLAYGTTKNFRKFKYINNNILKPGKNASIWTGSIIRNNNNDYVLFYTERYSNERYWANQVIRKAVSKDLVHWLKEETFRLSPDTIDPKNELYLRLPSEDDRSIHAWRDPFLFKEADRYWMIIEAKKQDGEKNRNACIVLLECENEELTKWSIVHPCLVTGYEELDVPQIFKDNTTGEISIFASTWDDSDYQESVSIRQGFQPLVTEQNTAYRSKPYLLQFTAKDFSALKRGIFYDNGKGKEVLTPERNIYAAIIIPEMKGSVVGCNTKKDGELKIIENLFPNLGHFNKEVKVYKKY